MGEIWDVASGIVSLVAVITGLPTIILFALQRKNANKKLEIDEGGLSVTQFNSLTAAYQDQLDRCSERTKTMRSELDEMQKQIDEVRDSESNVVRLLAETSRKLDRVRKLFLKYVNRAGIPMTQEEQQEFERTAPPRKRLSN